MKNALRIAIADDDAVVRCLLVRQLTDIGHTVVLEARTGKELLEGLSNVATDLVITDISMANLDGIDAAELAAARFELPVIFASGIEFDAILHRFGGCQAYAFLAKPFTQQQLKAAIAVAMQRFTEVCSLRRAAARADCDCKSK